MRNKIDVGDLLPVDYSDGLGGLDAMALQFKNLNKWPVENLTKKRLDLEPFWESPDKHIYRSYRSFDSVLTQKVCQDVNRVKTVWQPKLAAEARVLTFRAESGDLDLYSDPFFGTYSRAWSRYLVAESPSLQNFYSSFLPCYLFRRYMPYHPYQEEGSDYLELQYALCFAWEINVSAQLIIDDLLDETPERTGHQAWAFVHQYSRGMDTIILSALSMRICTDLVPDSHPCKAQLVTVFVEDIGTFVEFYAPQAELRDVANRASAHR